MDDDRIFIIKADTLGPSEIPGCGFAIVTADELDTSDLFGNLGALHADRVERYFRDLSLSTAVQTVVQAVGFATFGDRFIAGSTAAAARWFDVFRRRVLAVLASAGAAPPGRPPRPQARADAAQRRRFKRRRFVQQLQGGAS